MNDAIPFSRPLKVESIPVAGFEQTVEANPSERAALAALNGLPGIAHLSATFHARRIGRRRVEVKGNVHAELTQTCVVSLEPFDVSLDEPVDVRFAEPAPEVPARRGAPPPPPPLDIEAEAADSPDPIVNGAIDLGALAAEFMVLGLDPYPRKPGVEFVAPPDTPQPASAPGRKGESKSR